MQRSRIESPIIVDPTTNYRSQPSHKLLQRKVASVRELPLAQNRMHRLGCLRTDCRNETDKHFPRLVHRPTGSKSMAQKVEVLFWIIASSISIPAINDLGLLRIEFQLAFRKPLLKLVQQLASLILAAAVDDGSSRPGGLHRLPCPYIASSGHPRVDVEIDGASYGFLLDTGTQITLIREDILQRWSKEHPDWPHSIGAVGPANEGDRSGRFSAEDTDPFNWGRSR
jgi:hypothetical protein